MIDPGLNDKIALITGANNPHGIGAAIAMAFATMGTHVYLHYYRQSIEFPHQARRDPEGGAPGLAFFSQQQAKSANDVLRSIREAGTKADSWEADLGEARQDTELFSRAEERFRSSGTCSMAFSRVTPVPAGISLAILSTSA